MTYDFGGPDDVSWIRDATTPGLTIDSAIPPGFASYATLVVPDDEAPHRAHDQSIVGVLREHSPDVPWWLGFLETGGDPLPFADAPRVRLYAGWQYVLVEAGPDEALTLRPEGSWRTLPDVIFPSDRSWLVSTLWDDDWRCVGGPSSLVDALLGAEALETRSVRLGEDATPPGHVAR